MGPCIFDGAQQFGQGDRCAKLQNITMTSNRERHFWFALGWAMPPAPPLMPQIEKPTSSYGPLHGHPCSSCGWRKVARCIPPTIQSDDNGAMVFLWGTTVWMKRHMHNAAKHHSDKQPKRHLWLENPPPPHKQRNQHQPQEPHGQLEYIYQSPNLHVV